jgi:hypothetical protein
VAAAALNDVRVGDWVKLVVARATPAIIPSPNMTIPNLRITIFVFSLGTLHPWQGADALNLVPIQDICRFEKG